jgi:hypothetical protein
MFLICKFWSAHLGYFIDPTDGSIFFYGYRFPLQQALEGRVHQPHGAASDKYPFNFVVLSSFNVSRHAN